MLGLKVILIGWLLINLTYGSEQFNCTFSKLKLHEINIKCFAPGASIITHLTAMKFDKNSKDYEDRFVYNLDFIGHISSVNIWDEKNQSWISSSDFKVNYPAETYMEPMQEGEDWWNAKINMSNIAPQGISTIIQ
jgi:hypothetical protein